MMNHIISCLSFCNNYKVCYDCFHFQTWLICFISAVYYLRIWFKRNHWNGERNEKELTSYTYSFEELIRGKFLYVDKTEYIWNMIRPATAGYFLSCPRRFGKSLTVSTAVFLGKKQI